MRQRGNHQRGMKRQTLLAASSPGAHGLISAARGWGGLPGTALLLFLLLLVSPGHCLPPEHLVSAGSRL